MLTMVRMLLMLSASWKYAMPVDCMSMVWGASVMMRLEPTFDDNCCSAWVMYVGLTPFSRSMSTPSNPYVCMIEYTLLAKLVALVESPTLIVPFWPPTEMMTCLPWPCRKFTSLMKSDDEYPPSALDSPGSMLKDTAPGVDVAFAKATAIRL